MLVYIAAPLSNEAERTFNLKIRDLVRSVGLSTYLPQEDGGLFSDLIKKNPNEDAVRRELFQIDVDYLNRADIVLAVLDGRVPDEGMCFELGFAFALGKHCIGFKTDSRSALRGHDNLMIECALASLSRNWVDLRSQLEAAKEHR